MTVKASTLAALEAAMIRLLGGKPLHTDGSLTVANLAREARVGRATANRAKDVVMHFQLAVSARRPAASGDPKDDGINADTNSKEERRALRALASQVTILTLALRDAEREVKRLTALLSQERAARNDEKVLVLPVRTPG
ncbi:MAG: hypothetical protein H7Y60_06740 [Rhodospirillaceae bacterium]|nr:hypothetical protein [Rhodospirillales bacterium]